MGVVRRDIGLATLYCADWQDVELPGDAWLISDPPYGIGHGCNYTERQRAALAHCNDFADVHGDDQPFQPQPLLDMPSKGRVLWGANHYASRLPDSGGWLVWDKLRPDDLDQATCELAWTDCVKGVRRYSYLWNGMMRHGERGETYHPTQKPIALMKWILGLKWIGEGVVLDPYMGAGATGIAAVEMGREFVGVEIVPEYFEVACRRIEDAQRQVDMWGFA